MAILKKNKLKVSTDLHTVESVIILHQDDTGAGRLAVEKILVPKDKQIVLGSGENDLCWVQVLSGVGTLETKKLTKSHILFMSFGNQKLYVADEDSELLVCKVFDFRRFDTATRDISKEMRIIDWQSEPVLSSEHDLRKRIYVATNHLWGTKAVKGEIIFYPKGTEAPPHKHIGAEHFQYVLSGQGCAFIDNKKVVVRGGDLIYNFENEVHWFANPNNELFSFVEFFVPGDCQTIWNNDAKACTWIPTDRNFLGTAPAREIPKHVHGEKINI